MRESWIRSFEACSEANALGTDRHVETGGVSLIDRQATGGAIDNFDFRFSILHFSSGFRLVTITVRIGL